MDGVKKLLAATTSASSPATSSTTRIGAIVACAGLLVSALGAASEKVPLAVAPGSSTHEAIAAPCPTFSWGRFEGAVAHELVVYRIGEPGDEPEQVLSQRLPGPALVWTPSLDRCLPRGHRYAWSIWARNEAGEAGWSDPLLFEVRAEPSREEVAWALDVIRRHHGSDVETSELAEKRGAGQEGLDVFLSEEAELASTSSSAIAAGSAAAQLLVEGEVRTVDDSGAPRLWGKGRVSEVYGTIFLGSESACTNGDIKFGLSKIDVDWGSAADACPAGTWVCRHDELAPIPCDTIRPDGSCDARYFDGSCLDLDADKHRGWLAELNSGFDLGILYSEEGAGYIDTTCCSSSPVWCCWN